MTGEKLLTFEEFIEGDPPRYDNFFTYFIESETIGETYRSTPHFRKFSKENPVLEKRLTENVTAIIRLPDRREKIKPFERDMYEAYNIMRQYVESDEKLFS